MSPSRHDDTDPPEVRALIDEALTLVPTVVRMLQGHLAGRAQREDLASYGNEGALIAARTYDAGYGVPFQRWAILKIRAAMIDALRSEADLPRRLYERLRALDAAGSVAEGIALDDAGAAPPGSAAAADARMGDRLAAMATAYAAGLLMARDSKTLESIQDVGLIPDEELAREELKAAIRAAVREQPERERALLERYYFEGTTMSEAAGGLSRSWASRLHARAIGGVAASLRKVGSDP
jgi:RNA polymerase sigma factor FliA